jgi:alpha-tubulin suppressor-like RCC1 family protein
VAASSKAIEAFSSGTYQIVGGGAKESSSSYAITKDGNLWVSGYNADGQLGTGNIASVSQWTKATTYGLAGHVLKIAANSGSKEGQDNTSAFVVTDDGFLLVTGYNWDGQLGIGTNTNVLTWKKITTIQRVVDVSVSAIATSTSAYVITEDGQMWVSGRNQFGQLGLGSLSNVTNWTKINIDGLSGFVSKVVSNGLGFTLSAYTITKNGDLWVTGKNNYHLLGIDNSGETVLNWT